jgi:SAM-dependent methyltransferase
LDRGKSHWKDRPVFDSFRGATDEMSEAAKSDGRDGQFETLEDLSEAFYYNRWIFKMMEPHLGSRVLEVGCGIGNMTGFLAVNRSVLAVDIHEGYLREARKKFKNQPKVSFKKIDLTQNLHSARSFRPDTVVCVNVFEHLKQDEGFLQKCLRLLPKGGRLLLFVPAIPALYGTMDEHYGHFRRYSKSGLIEKTARNGYATLQCRYLNLLGILGWWWNGRVLKKKIIPKGQILLYNQIIRWAAPVEKYLPRPIGLSIFYAGQK